MEVIARDIHNLTDARYFAAKMVDYLVVSKTLCSVESIPVIKELKGWVDGVDWVCEVGQNRDELAFILQETKIEYGLLTPDLRLDAMFPQGVFYDVDNLQNPHEPEARLIIRDLALLPNLGQALVYYQIDSVNQLRGLDDKRLAGIVVSGSNELKTGLKDFDHLELIFDYLEEVNH
ncbi:MAG: hypothetical protein KTR24_08760 [Saprospiraceae bacterium]|nr:hypothetical protein [Saprospiraceae bacterium]